KADFIVDEQAMQIAPLNRQFGGKSVGGRLLTIFAGPFMNFLLAFMLFLTLAAIQGVPINEAQMGELISGSPAKESGLQEGDHIISINDNPVNSWERMTKIIRKNPGNELAFKVNRDGQTLEIPVTPDKVSKDDEVIGQVGTYQPTEHSVTG